MHGQAWRKQPELYSFFYNGHAFPGDKIDQITAFYYGVLLPWRQVHYRNVESFRREGERTPIGLEGNSSIDLDWKFNSYKVIANGVEIASGGDTYCPVRDDRIAFYSKTGKRLTASLPKGWDPAAITARALFADRSEETPLEVRGGKVSVDVPAERPVMVFRNK
jgi:hypothetical protein